MSDYVDGYDGYFRLIFVFTVCLMSDESHYDVGSVNIEITCNLKQFENVFFIRSWALLVVIERDSGSRKIGRASTNRVCWVMSICVLFYEKTTD